MKLPAQPLRNSVRISVDDVRPGMFIAALDRPWAETPFLLQGFLLEAGPDLATIRACAQEATIDPSRSVAAALAHLPWDALHEPLAPDTPLRRPTASASASKAVVATPSNASWLQRLLARLRGDASVRAAAAAERIPYFLRYPDEPMLASGARQNKAARSAALTPPSSQQFSQFLAGLYPRDTGGEALSWRESWRLWRERRRVKPSRTERTRPPAARADFLPADMPLVVYTNQATTAQEVQRAQDAVRHSDAVMARIASDIRADLPIDLNDFSEVVSVLVDSVVSNPAALLWSLRMRDQSSRTYRHGLKVAVYMMALGRHLGFPKPQLTELGNIGLMLDIGMLNIPEELVDKSAPLSDDENRRLMQHVADGVSMLEKGGPLPADIVRGIREHHERIDGSGYPAGLEGAAISIYGRMAAIADTFAAMTSARAYDITHSPFDALKALFAEARTRLHAPLVEQFVQAIGIFPVGSLIELTSGEVAVVLEHNSVRRLEPTVLVLTDTDKELLQQPFTRDLMVSASARVDPIKILRGLADGAYDIDYREYYSGSGALH